MGDEVAAALGRAGVDDELARDVIERAQHRDLLGLSRRRHAQVGARLAPRRGRDRDASAPRSRRRRAERCRRLRPAACAVADAGRSARPRWRSGVPSACAGAAASGTFFSQRLGQLRTADADTLARFDLGAQAGDRPVRPVGHRLLQQGRDDAQRRLALHRRQGPARRSPSAPRRRRARNRCATAEPCLRARRTPRRSADWSNRPASAARRAPDPPRRDRATRQEPSRPRAVRRSPQLETCRPCRPRPNQSTAANCKTSPLVNQTGICLVSLMSEHPATDYFDVWQRYHKVIDPAPLYVGAGRRLR